MWTVFFAKMSYGKFLIFEKNLPMISENLLYFKKLNPHIIEAKYLQGVPNINDNFIIRFDPKIDSIGFSDIKKDKIIFRIYRKDIVKISVEDQSTLENRVGFKRLLLVGIFAFAWKKRQKVPLSFLVIDYKNEFDEIQEVFIQSEKPSGFQDFTNIKYNLQKFWKDADETEDFDSVILETEKVYKAQDAQETKGCRNMILFFLIIFLIAFIFSVFSK